MNFDLFPTLLGLAGGEVPGDRTMDGKNIWPVLQGREHSPHEYLYFFNNQEITAVRSQRWKFVVRSYYRRGLTRFEGERGGKVGVGEREERKGKRKKGGERRKEGRKEEEGGRGRRGGKRGGGERKGREGREGGSEGGREGGGEGGGRKGGRVGGGTEGKCMLYNSAGACES
jgi:hypothetical protein